MGTRKSNRLVALLVCLALASCSKPKDNYSFVILNEDGTSDASFLFDIDSAVSYSTYFCCRYDIGRIDREKLKLYIKATAPSGRTYRDTIEFPLYRTKEHAAGDAYTKFHIEQNWNANIEWTWRLNVASEETGEWTIQARPESYTGLHSLGFSYHPDGKRDEREK